MFSFFAENTKGTVTDNHYLAKSFNKLFSNIVQNLGISSKLEAVTSTLDTSYPILSTIKKHENHPSIVWIKREINNKKLCDNNGIQTHNQLVRKRSVRLNDWAFVYELSSCGFESRCCHLNFRYGACFEQGVPWHSGKL